MKRTLEIIPAWVLTGVTLVVILILTLMPAPPDAPHIELFPGADKVVHGVMFGALTLVALIDWARGRPLRSVRWPICVIMASLSSLVGVAVEYLQEAMALGRSFDTGDILADATGAFLVALIWTAAEKWRT